MGSKIRVLDLFAGAGGFTIACEMAGGYETVAFCEIDSYAQKVLAKNWPDVPIFSDVTKLKADHIAGTVDVITGGFPCQDLSAAGAGAGIGEGTRSGLFREMLRIAQEFQGKQGFLPCIVFENVPRLLSGPSEDPGQWFGEFLWSLAEIGYDAEWFCISAASVGAPHLRERVCVVAYPNQNSWQAMRGEHEASAAACSGWNNVGGCCEGMAEREIPIRGTRQTTPNTHQTPIERGGISRRVYQEHANIDCATCWWSEWGGGEPEICGVDDGVSKGSYARRNGIMGNAIVPQVFAIVMEALRGTLQPRL